MKIEYHPEAVAEFEQATRFYNNRDGTRSRFVTAVSGTLDRIMQAPRRWRAVRGEVRRCLCPVFPYAIFYIIDDDAIFIIAIMHLHRDPDYWQTRIEK